VKNPLNNFYQAIPNVGLLSTLRDCLQTPGILKTEDLMVGMRKPFEDNLCCNIYPDQPVGLTCRFQPVHIYDLGRT